MSLFKNFSFDKIKNGLERTKEKLTSRIIEILTGKAKIDDDLLENLEEILISSDVGAETTEKILENLKRQLKNENNRSSEIVIKNLKLILEELIIEDSKNFVLTKLPYVILIVGVNGVGKTTTIGKLAYNYKNINKKVLVVAGDTFRAAANQQLEIWAKRANVEIFQKLNNSDPSSVIFDALNKSKNEKFDIVLIDTAGRLHNKNNLMSELNKIYRVIEKVLNRTPDETLLVLDANTGQNAISQVKEFIQILPLSGLVVTKLDGTAKGGIIINLCQKFNLPVRYIGVGENISDLLEFNKKVFVEALFDK